MSRGNEDYQALRWASLSGGPSDQCALLMRVGNTTVMEFSHSGKARIWDDNQRVRNRAPRLHNDRCRADELRADCPESRCLDMIHKVGGELKSTPFRSENFW